LIGDLAISPKKQKRAKRGSALSSAPLIGDLAISPGDKFSAEGNRTRTPRT
jgi:hypothetical protein